MGRFDRTLQPDRTIHLHLIGGIKRQSIVNLRYAQVVFLC
jgi:hypothetical protein